MYSELDNQHHIKEVGARLSSHLWYAWRDRVFNIKRKNKRYATFDEFVEFVTEKADEANDPVYGQKSSSASFSEKSRPSPTPKRATALNNVGSSDFKRKACDVCQEQHPVWRCDIFESVHENIIDVLSISFLKILGAKNNSVRSSSDQY